ncbi:MAG: hypothetical protein AUH81_04085 [Candidatus Rokubacteria bacterium 13_1_40CM_4_69_5]|nr:MAG: hypothetical protein AUH81_04085 [Candidatus Rokubacteria bacterium 13_1_40CM_4_69_5]
MKRLVWLGLVVLVVATGVWGYLYVQSRGQGQQYRLARVERGPLTAAVSATGNLNAVITVLVGSQVSGNIKNLYVDFNSPVKKGQVIARIDPEMLQAQVNQAKAQLEAARAAMANQEAVVEKTRADLANAKAALASAKAQTVKAQVAVADGRRNVSRQQELRQRDLIAQSDLDAAQVQFDSAVAQHEATVAQERAQAAAVTSAEAQLKVAEAQLKNAKAIVAQNEANLRQAEINLEHTVIVAPVDGVVVSRTVDVGQTVAASLQAPTLFTIAQDLTQMQVETSVDEADIGKVRLDGIATFTVDAFAGETFSGRVTQIRKAPVVNQNVVTYIVIVAVANPDGKLLPGMTANVKLVIAEKPNVLKIPNAALRFRPAGAEAGEPAPRVSGGASPSRPGRGENLREGLVRGLGLTAEQQAKLDPILTDRRSQLQALQSAGLSESRAQQILETMRARIREMLTAEQRARYDQFPAEGRGGGTPGRVFGPGPDGRPKAVPVMLGLSDGTFTEVLGGELKEGQEVIVGTLGAGGQNRPQGGPAGGGPRLRL